MSRAPAGFQAKEACLTTNQRPETDSPARAYRARFVPGRIVRASIQTIESTEVRVGVRSPTVEAASRLVRAYDAIDELPNHRRPIRREIRRLADRKRVRTW
jgi:hypothetical protein